MLLSKAIYATFKLYIYNLNQTHDLGFAGIILYCYRYEHCGIKHSHYCRSPQIGSSYWNVFSVTTNCCHCDANYAYRSLFTWMHLKYIYSLSICLLLNFWWVCNKISIIPPIYLNYAFFALTIALESDPYSQWKALIYGEVTESPLRPPAGFAAGRLILR